MFRVSPETAASAATFNARSKQARPLPSQSDGFSALVDSNAPDQQRDATPAQDTQTQRLDGNDTPPKADNRPETRADSRTGDSGKKALKSSKSNSKAEDNGEAGAKAQSSSDSKASAKAAAKADSDAVVVATANASADKDGADAAASLTEDAAAAALANAGKIEISADAKVVAASGDTAKAEAAKSSADGKAKDADATDAATPIVPAVLTDTAAIVAVAIPVTTPTDAQATTPAPKTDAPIAGIEAAANAAATLATAAASAAATADTKAAANPNASATPINPAASPANNPAVATATDAAVAVSADDAATAAAAKTQAQPLTATDVAAPDVAVASAEAAAAQPIVPTKPKAAPVSENSGKTSVTDTATATDSSSTLSLPGQTAEAKAPRGAEHTKGESDKTASTDKSDAAPSDTKSANANAPAPAPAAHHASAAARAAPDDLTLQPVQTQQAPAPQAQQQNFTVTPAVPLNATLANTPVPVSGLAVDIALRAAGGSSRFEIRLDPAELGRIDVRLDVDKHGNVTSHLTVEKPATLDMLRRDAPQLQQALEDAGLKTGDSGLQFSLRDQSSGRNDDNGSGRNSQRLIISEDDTVPAQVAGRTYGRALGSSSGVDIRV